MSLTIFMASDNVPSMAKESGDPERLDQGLMRERHQLAVDQDEWVNEMVEEALQDVLKSTTESVRSRGRVPLPESSSRPDVTTAVKDLEEGS